MNLECREQGASPEQKEKQLCQVSDYHQMHGKTFRKPFTLVEEKSRQIPLSPGSRGSGYNSDSQVQNDEREI